MTVSTQEEIIKILNLGVCKRAILEEKLKARKVYTYYKDVSVSLARLKSKNKVELIQGNYWRVIKENTEHPRIIIISS